MAFRIVADSSCNVLQLPDPDYTTVPLRLNGEREYVDDVNLDVAQMVAELKGHKGKTGSSCPNVGDWLAAFGDATEIFGITISRNLSGCYNAAVQAAQTYMEEHPGRRVFIVDSYGTGPAMMFIAEKIRQCEAQGLDFEATRLAVCDYANHLYTMFGLENITNLARNGRVSPAVAKLIGMLGIHLAGVAEDGAIAIAHKPRGKKKTIEVFVKMVMESGFRDGSTLRIAHCYAQDSAEALREALLPHFPHMKCIIEPTTALCSFYAEEGGFILGFEGDYNSKNECKRI